MKPVSEAKAAFLVREFPISSNWTGDEELGSWACIPRAMYV